MLLWVCPYHQGAHTPSYCFGPAGQLNICGTRAATQRVGGCQSPAPPLLEAREPSRGTRALAASRLAAIGGMPSPAAGKAGPAQRTARAACHPGPPPSRQTVPRAAAACTGTTNARARAPRIPLSRLPLSAAHGKSHVLSAAMPQWITLRSVGAWLTQQWPHHSTIQTKRHACGGAAAQTVWPHPMLRSSLYSSSRAG